MLLRPASWLSLLLPATQLPLQAPVPNRVDSVFTLNTGDDIFSPKDMLELPRPQHGVANPDGDLVFVSYSQYSFETKKATKSILISLLDSSAASVEVFGSEAFWIDSRTLALVSPGIDSGPALLAVSLQVERTAISAIHPAFIGTLPRVDASNFRFSPAANMLVFSANVYADYNLSSVYEQDVAFENRGDSALIFDTTYVRHWDTWQGKKRPSLFSVSLSQDTQKKWVLGEEYHAPLAGSGHYTPVEPFGGADCFDASSSDIIYTAKDPAVPEAWHTRQHIYTVPIKGGKKPRQLTVNGKGATSSPVFNKKADMAAWLQMEQDGFEADRNRIIIYDFKKNALYTVAKHWDRSPDSITFSLDGTSLFVTAGDLGHVKIYMIDLSPNPKQWEAVVPIGITMAHASAAVQPLSSGRLLFTQSSFTSPNNVFVIYGLDKPDKPLRQKRITTFGQEELKAKALEEASEFWFKGANERLVHGWAIKPKGWVGGQKKKYPVVLLIHGGPQSAWEDQWSTRWNPNVFAQQGYFVIAINPTGSTTYGQEFTDGISENWGGKPFVDLKKGWSYALDTYPEIDSDRAVAAGASWGGYAINWIQGHDEFGFGFKALVCHDGVFDTLYSGYATDELYFFNHEFGGNPADRRARNIAEKWNPARFTHKWNTPQLVIHSGRDYRLPDTEGISAFQALQIRGVKSRFVYFPEENHWVLKPENSLRWHFEVFRFFDEFVGDRDSEESHIISI